MVTIDELRSRYIALAGLRPASTNLLEAIESNLTIQLPATFREVCQFFDGSGLNTLSMFSLAGNAPKLNPLDETLRLRAAVGLPASYLVLGEPPESLIVMECSGNGKVVWLDAIDATRLASQSFVRPPEIWDSFANFFDYLLTEEEAD